jgi:uncharacterized protein YjbJ (UPF0337 family)
LTDVKTVMRDERKFRPRDVLPTTKGDFGNPTKEEKAMNQDQMQGKFDQLRGKIKETWGRLSDDDIALANGKMEQFFGKLQEKYGLAKEDAQKRFDELTKTCGCGSDKPGGCGSNKAA